jgi:hypothetical protein
MTFNLAAGEVAAGEAMLVDAFAGGSRRARLHPAYARLAAGRVAESQADLDAVADRGVQPLAAPRARRWPARPVNLIGVSRDGRFLPDVP